MKFMIKLVKWEKYFFFLLSFNLKDVSFKLKTHALKKKK